MAKLTNDQLILSIEVLSAFAQYLPKVSKEHSLSRLSILIDELTARATGVRAPISDLERMLASYGVEPFVDMYEFDEDSKPNVFTIVGDKDE